MPIKLFILLHLFCSENYNGKTKRLCKTEVRACYSRQIEIVETWKYSKKEVLELCIGDFEIEN